MSGIIFGNGTFIRVLDDAAELRIDDGIPNFTEEAGDTAAPAVRMLADTSAEMTVTLNRSQLKRLTWAFCYGKSCFWPVSNNWLRMHGYPMRRRVQHQRAIRLYHCKLHIQMDWRSI